jgi:hypothetical protein
VWARSGSSTSVREKTIAVTVCKSKPLWLSPAAPLRATIAVPPAAVASAHGTNVRVHYNLHFTVKQNFRSDIDVCLPIKLVPSQNR